MLTHWMRWMPIPRLPSGSDAERQTNQAPMNQPPEQLAEGTLISHLLELRSRLLRALVVVGIAFLPCVYYANALFTLVARPLLAKLPEGSNLIATGVMSPFTTPFKLSFFAALMLATPYVIYQLWAFVAPGLYRDERRFAVPLLGSSILLFYIGIAFAYYFVFPAMFEFFARTTPKGVAMMTDINNYLDFVLTMFLCFGLAFEVPIAVVLLVVMGIVPIDTLKKNRGYVLIGIFILAALLTPPDATSQCSLAIPMYLLYEGGILMAALLTPSYGPAAQEKTEPADASVGE
jgi:sec-independent protein translocase protein TatC